MRSRFEPAFAAAAAFAMVASAMAAEGPLPPRKERVNFAKGASSATIKATMKGYDTVDYVVRAAAGQTLAVQFEGTNSQNDFNVLPPGSKDVAMYASQMTGERSYSGLLPTDGDYTIRVFINRAAARRQESSKYVLTVAVSGQALPPLASARDAKVAGTTFHARSVVNCVPPYASAAEECAVGIVRRGRDGTATVEFRGKNPALVRRILFVQGQAMATDASSPFTASKKDDTSTVTIGDERYDVPDAFLTGG